MYGRDRDIIDLGLGAYVASIANGIGHGTQTERKALALLVAHAGLAVQGAELALEAHEDRVQYAGQLKGGLAPAVDMLTPASDPWHMTERKRLEIELDRARLSQRERELAVERWDCHDSSSAAKTLAGGMHDAAKARPANPSPPPEAPPAATLATVAGVEGMSGAELGRLAGNGEVAAPAQLGQQPAGYGAPFGL